MFFYIYSPTVEAGRVRAVHSWQSKEQWRFLPNPTLLGSVLPVLIPIATLCILVLLSVFKCSSFSDCLFFFCNCWIYFQPMIPPTSIFCMCCGFCSVSLKCVQLCLEDLSLKQTVCHKPFQHYLLSIEIRKTTITSCDWYRKRKPPCQPLDTKINQSRLGYAHFLRLFGAWWLFLLFLSAVVIILVVVLQHPPKMQFTSYLNVPVGNFPHFLWVHCESVRQSWFVTLFLISGRRF